ncbi:MAG: hypothetical protein JW867_00600 [Candidatus Omnitrophica bacterium]|nr:hypothetical protein [Candidatus Omnitrophota bacterium]
MPKNKITARQKDIPRLLRDKKRNKKIIQIDTKNMTRSKNLYIPFAVLFFSFTFYAFSAGASYRKAFEQFSLASDNFRLPRLHQAYGHYDQAIFYAHRALSYESLKPDEIEKAKDLIRDSKNQKMRIIEITRNFQKLIRERKISRGMTKEQVVASIGEPDDIRKTIYLLEELEEWTYGNILKDNDKYIYIKDGVVTHWEDKTKK